MKKECEVSLFVRGGSVAGKARRDLETKTGKKVVTSENYLPDIKRNKQLDKGKQK